MSSFAYIALPRALPDSGRTARAIFARFFLQRLKKKILSVLSYSLIFGESGGMREKKCIGKLADGEYCRRS